MCALQTGCASHGAWPQRSVPFTRAGYVIGDVNEKNIKINELNDVGMMDCDSYGFTDPVTRRTLSSPQARWGAPSFSPPEAQIKGGYANRTENHDLLRSSRPCFPTAHRFPPLYRHPPARPSPAPATGSENGLFPPARSDITTTDVYYRQAWERLTSLQKEMFLRCFSKQNYGKPRPTPDHWLVALREVPEAPPAKTPEAEPPAPPRPRPPDTDRAETARHRPGRDRQTPTGPRPPDTDRAETARHARTGTARPARTETASPARTETARHARTGTARPARTETLYDTLYDTLYRVVHSSAYSSAHTTDRSAVSPGGVGGGRPALATRGDIPWKSHLGRGVAGSEFRHPLHNLHDGRDRCALVAVVSHSGSGVVAGVIEKRQHTAQSYGLGRGVMRRVCLLQPDNRPSMERLALGARKRFANAGQSGSGRQRRAGQHPCSQPARRFQATVHRHPCSP